ncbi:MAG: hypothetical protein ACRC8L_12200 [Plesiomonas shigelloides]
MMISISVDLGQSLQYYPKLATKLGGTTAAVLFCHFLRYCSHEIDEVLGVHQTAEEIGHETGLSYTEQATARKKLKALGVLTETHKRLEHRIYYKICWDAFNALVSDCIDNAPSKMVTAGEV